MNGICMCVSGPPPGGICGACGAWGAGYHPPYRAPQNPLPMPDFKPGPITFVPAPLTADEVRKIVREELERAGMGKSDG